MASFKEKYGPWALVVGSSAGLGKCFAKVLTVLACKTGTYHDLHNPSGLKQILQRQRRCCIY